MGKNGGEKIEHANPSTLVLKLDPDDILITSSYKESHYIFEIALIGISKENKNLID